MRANTDEQDFLLLAEQYRELVKALVNVVNMPSAPLNADPTPAGNFRGFDGNHFYVVRSGVLNARFNGKTIYTLEEGDILLPDITGVGSDEISVFYSAQSAASLDVYPALDFMQRVFDDGTATRLWTRLLITYSGIMLRIAAQSSQEDAPTTPGFEVYEPGEVIIQQGERADYVFNMSSGVAEVLVDEVTVGRIADGEIFGAMAALTHADRSATVRAKTTCSVVKVPKEQFTELIKSNPATIHSLLIDMANSIVNLNEQLVGSRTTRRIG